MNPFVANPFSTKQNRTGCMTGPIITISTRMQIIPKSCRTSNRTHTNSYRRKNSCSSNFRGFQIKKPCCYSISNLRTKRISRITFLFSKNNIFKKKSFSNSYSGKIKMRFILTANAIIGYLPFFCRSHTQISYCC